MLLLALLLAVGLPRGVTGANVSISRRQDDRLRCHACEEENRFQCRHEVTCEAREQMCVIAAVKIFPRFYYVSKHCAEYCPIIIEPAAPKPLLLDKPLPFLYARCCSATLCNQDGPEINETTFREYYARAEERSSSAGLAVLLALASASLGQRLL
ncbi:lymphocyte antigen 6K isoform X1 [Dasypus novemcinctus]|uniref:lymphocyte antigen 6K isoform X1 n=1 Tax=Dasypus novemcinctus TaxID=9361 RepID=UPI00265EDA64|nr:lymphocyte antigen 6K isoform X1 [Dasypus novemcinctus]